jgi:adenylate cyclase
LSRLRNPLVVGSLLSVILALVFGAHRYGWRLPGVGDFLEALELRTSDIRFDLRGSEDPGPETVILVFDDETFAKDPFLFERRAGWSKVIRKIKEAGARVIAVDALFESPEILLSRSLIDDILKYLSGDPETSSQYSDFARDPLELLRRVQQEVEGDRLLAKAIEEAGNVVLAMHLGTSGESTGFDDPALRKGRYGQSVPGPADPYEAQVLMASLARFNQVADALGAITVTEDTTGTVRRLNMVFRHGANFYLPLAAQLVARYRNLSRGRLAYIGPAHTVSLGEQSFVLDPGNGFYLNFRGPAGTFETHPVIDLIEGRLPPAALADRIVLLGITHMGYDSARTPYGRAFPAVELQATAVDNILKGDFLFRAPPWLDFLVCLGLGFLISLLYWQRLSLPLWIQISGSAVLLFVYLGVGQYLFSAHDLWLFWTGPVFVFVVLTLSCLALSYWGEGMQRRRIRRTFAHYLSDDVIHKMLADPGALALGGDRRELTTLFSDIRGFTNLSEHVAPEELTLLLNTYFTPMTRAVLAQGGLLDKYIGDALMAVFGAPVPDPDHAERALFCVLHMHEELKTLQENPLVAKFGLDIGVGVNTGEMVVGNMGSEERFDYTVVGDAVNLASRLEGLTRAYGVFCLVGERTRRAASEDFSFREVDRVQVKGKSQAVAIHELLSGPGCVIAEYAERARFEEGVSAYRGGNFPDAREAFQSFQQSNPHDQVVTTYLERLEELGDRPPENWDGVAVHKTK